MNLVPVEAVETRTTSVDFYYNAQLSASANADGPDDDEGILYTWYYDYQTDSEGFLVPGATPYYVSRRQGGQHEAEDSVNLGSVGNAVWAVYGPVHSPDEGIDPVPPYEHPPGAIAPPPGTGETEPGAGDDGEGTPEDGDDTGGGEPGEGDDTGETPDGGPGDAPGTGVSDDPWVVPGHRRSR